MFITLHIIMLAENYMVIQLTAINVCELQQTLLLRISNQLMDEGFCASRHV